MQVEAPSAASGHGNGISHRELELAYSLRFRPVAQADAPRRAESDAVSSGRLSPCAPAL
jgi:hypothetical protein